MRARWVQRLAFGLLMLAAAVTGLAQQQPASTGVQALDLSALLRDIRADQEVMADFVFGGGSRPTTWVSNRDVNSPSIIADSWFNNEQLADQVFGTGQRPLVWIGATSSNALIVVRNVRHDLELTADAVFGAGQRPPNWTGGPRLFRCSRTIMNTVQLLETLYNVRPTTLLTVFDYCAALAGELQSQILPRIIEAQAETPNWAALTLAVRGDLERLADEELGLNNRPPGWIANKDEASPTLADDNRTDLESLADTLLGVGVRPVGWIGQPSTVPALAFRNLRFDLEALADATQGVGVRPRGWQGVDPLQSCTPSVQGLVDIVRARYGFVPDPTPGLSAEEACREIETQANLLAENPPADLLAMQGPAEDDGRNIGESRIAFAYLDPAATLFMGEMPAGVRFRAWYRNFGGSNMMFVSGEDFALYIDRRWTTFPESAFNRLPTLEGVRPLAFCNASWCNGPRSTPTPTGDVLFDVLTFATPPATIAPGQNVSGTGKQLVSWNRIRVTYVAQNTSPGRAQVALEICQDDAQINCEPVISVLNLSTGVPVPIVSTFNGLNVFELPYGYSTNVIIEGLTLFSQDIWLNDPAITGS
jgi:hypothetical protein